MSLSVLSVETRLRDLHRLAQPGHGESAIRHPLSWRACGQHFRSSRHGAPLEQRIWQHNHGKDEGGASYTTARRPVVLVCFEEYELMIGAYGREKQLQNWGHKKRVALMEGRIADLVKRMPPDVGCPTAT